MLLDSPSGEGEPKLFQRRFKPRLGEESKAGTSIKENYNFRDGNLSLKKEKEEEEDREEEEEKEDEVEKEEVEGAQSLGTTPASGLRLHQWLWAWRMGVADLGRSEPQNMSNQLQT
ncbi:Sodium Channel Protein Type 4 Subunit Alpha [Manis pentadactyla]|nr:Sodium Channel Protein Type 4 Subunit Alpha [Manis pentadactyla]